MGRLVFAVLFVLSFSTSLHFSLSAAFLTDVSGDLYMGVSLGMVKSKHK